MNELNKSMAPPTRDRPADRLNSTKPQLHYSLVYKRGMEALAATMEYGADKYEYLNFARGGKPDQEYLDAAMRHLTQHSQVLVDGDEEHYYDDESGCMHLAHAVWNLLTLLEYNRTYLPIKRDEAPPF